MDPFVWYYLHQAGRGRADNGISPIYSNQPYLQRGREIGSIVGGLWRSIVRALLWQGAKTMGSETLATGRNILTLRILTQNFVKSYVET